MSTVATTLDGYLKNANIGRAFSVLGIPSMPVFKDTEFVLIYTSYAKRTGLTWFWASVRKVLEDNLAVAYRYDDIPEGEPMKDTTFLYVVPPVTAEKICEHFDEIASNDTIDPKYLEPIYPERGDAEFVW